MVKRSGPDAVCRAAGEEGRGLLKMMRLFELQSRCGHFGAEINSIPCRESGHAVAQFVEALRYKLEGRGFNSRVCHWIFLLT